MLDTFYTTADVNSLPPMLLAVRLVSWKLGAVELPLDILMTSCVLILMWAVILPLLVKFDFHLRENSYE